MFHREFVEFPAAVFCGRAGMTQKTGKLSWKIHHREKRPHFSNDSTVSNPDHSTRYSGIPSTVDLMSVLIIQYIQILSCTGTKVHTQATFTQQSNMVVIPVFKSIIQFHSHTIQSFRRVTTIFSRQTQTRKLLLFSFTAV